MAADSRIDRILGSTKQVVAKDSKQFGREISKYIDSKDQRRGGDKDKGKSSSSGGSGGNKGKAAPAKSTGNFLMDLVRKKVNAQASVFSGSGAKTPNSAPASNSGSGSGSAPASGVGAGTMVLANAGGSKNAEREVNIEDLELWPLIRSVKVRCNSAALKTGTNVYPILVFSNMLESYIDLDSLFPPFTVTGAILCDLPGTADANAARNSIAKNYMKNCDCIWILAPITRAVDDRTARG